MPAASTTIETQSPRSGVLSSSARLVSLDVLRGLTIAAMILVNDPGDELASYWPLQHAQWNGWTPTDLIFPFFLFMVGVSMSFSFASRIRRGESSGNLLKHVLWRGFLLFAIGVFLNGFPNRFHPGTIRIYGVLQRIAVCYVIAALLTLWTGTRGRFASIAACLLGYWVMMRFLPVPGFGTPTHDIPLLDPDRNLVAWLDRKLLLGHLYEGTRDPEGLLSSIPAVATCVLGVLTGDLLRSYHSRQSKAWRLAGYGFLCVALGKTWNLWFPINKKLWTSSYVLFTAGLALLCLALCYWLIDIRGWRGGWTKVVAVFGSNAIAAYAFAELIAHMIDRLTVRTSGGALMSLQEWLYHHSFASLASPANASLMYALSYVLVCWLAMLVLYRRKIFLKI
jgi:predicted acyltransferase